LRQKFPTDNNRDGTIIFSLMKKNTMEEQKTNEESKEIDHFIQHVKEYSENGLDLLALEFEEKFSEIISSIAFSVLIGFFSILILFFLTVGIAWWLGKITGSIPLGFFLVAGFYFVLSLAIYFFKERLILSPIINFFMRKINIHEEN
jgi:ABC-type multidrug transport system fused ATPase/permease subunit